MKLVPLLPAEDLHHFHNALAKSVAVRSHFDALVWLQGDMQRYLSHNILIAAWGDFQAGAIQHDIISPMKGVRTANSSDRLITPLMSKLFNHWTKTNRRPFAFHCGPAYCQLLGSGMAFEVSSALLKMNSAMVHGVHDQRGSDDCIYVIFSDKKQFDGDSLLSMGLALPFVDTALRQIKMLSQQGPVECGNTEWQETRPLPSEQELSDREAEVLHWVNLGKTNAEIGTILEISEFTVKNHMQRIFKKLDVFNRAQAVGKFKTLVGHAQ